VTDVKTYVLTGRYVVRPGLSDPHQACGGRGRHCYLVANFARLGLKLWIRQTLEHFPDQELHGEPTWVWALSLTSTTRSRFGGHRERC
jgi:cytochrome P450